MHEGDFIQAVVDHVLKTLEKHPFGTVRKIRLRTGEMLHIVAESVQFYYDLLTEGTNAANAKIEVKQVAVRISCQACGYEGTVEDHHLLICPDCLNQTVKLLAGKDFEIAGIEIETSQRKPEN